MTTQNEHEKNDIVVSSEMNGKEGDSKGPSLLKSSSSTDSITKLKEEISITKERSNSLGDKNNSPATSPLNLGTQIQNALTPVTQAFARLSTLASESQLVTTLNSLKNSSGINNNNNNNTNNNNNNNNNNNSKPPFWKRKGKVPGYVKPVKGTFSPRMEKPHGYMARPPTPPKSDLNDSYESPINSEHNSPISSPHVSHTTDQQNQDMQNGLNHHPDHIPRTEEYEHNCQSFKTCGTPAERASRLSKFQKILSEPVVDLEALRKISWKGIPYEVRPMTWKILLGYLPANVERRESTLERKRKEYWDCIPQYFDVKDEDRPEYEQKIFRQIHIDVPRTNPNVALFQQPIVQEVLERILYVWAIRHPASGYVQGINDLATPFFVVFLSSLVDDVDNCDVSTILPASLALVEADSYWCMSKLLDGIQDHYTFAQPGIQRMTFKLKELVNRIDAPLAKHLEQQDAQFIQFAFRWMNCLLMREMPLALIVRMWDTYLAEGTSEGFSVFHVYVCAAFLVMWSDELRLREFQDIMLFLQHLPTQTWQCKDIELLVSHAYMWMMIFQNAPSHLKS